MRYYYKVTLLSDVVMSAKSSTEQSESLDYLTGSSFMGIAANHFYRNNPNLFDMFTAFHSGKIRFLDAHPLVENKQTLKIPLILFEEKVPVDKNNKKYYYAPAPIQTKQVRQGFFVSEEKSWNTVKPTHVFSLKSSYNREKRRSKDEHLFGMDALRKGSAWLFILEFDDDCINIADEINTHLDNKTHRIGKSKTSQYGQIAVERINNFQEHICSASTNDNHYKIYAATRLCFYDENNQPTFQPTPQQLGFEQGTICWDKSQIRTSVFTPRNGKRRSWDGDIVCIEKGSVFVVESDSGHNGNNCIGSHKTIGMGQILVNPDFLASVPMEIEDRSKEKKSSPSTGGIILEEVHTSNMKQWLAKKSSETKAEEHIYETVKQHLNKIIPDNDKEITRSQWGVLREKIRKAIDSRTNWIDFSDSLFNEPNGYFHKKNVKNRWNQVSGRLENMLREFNKTHPEHIFAFFDLLCGEAQKRSKGGE